MTQLCRQWPSLSSFSEVTAQQRLPVGDEEDETALYQHLSSLIRFRDGEWMCRGLGDAKFLMLEENGKDPFYDSSAGYVEDTGQLLRSGLGFVLSADACSQSLLEHLNFLACDFSGGEPETERLALN